MTSPFRSEVEQLREQLRRAEEKMRDAESRADLLQREKVGMQREMARGRRPLALTIGVSATLAIASLGILYLGMREEISRSHASATSADLRREMEARAAGEAKELCVSQLANCQMDLAAASGRMNPAYGQGQLGVVPHANPASVPRQQPACTCQAGDPLCSCDDNNNKNAPFDRGAAAAALGAATRTLEPCISPARIVTFHTKVTFAASGHVTEATVDDDQSGTLTSFEKQCVTQRLRTLTIPAFGGAPVTVGKSYSLGSTP